MKFIPAILPLLAATILASCSTTSTQRISGIDVTVTCSEAGMPFKGTIITNGHPRPIFGTGTTTFHLTGHKLSYSFKKSNPGGRISLTVMKGQNCVGTATTDRPYGGVQGSAELRLGTVEQQEVSAF